MAIKKRDRTSTSAKPVIDERALEAFAASADNPIPQTQAVAEGVPASESVAKSILIRWPNLTLPSELLRIASELDRSQHKTALLALELGLRALADQLEDTKQRY